MNHHYRDIRSRIPTPPVWFDENAVPRYDVFTPKDVADIYAAEVCLLRIECQRCGHRFDVALAWKESDAWFENKSVPSLTDRIFESSIVYGDPPNIECCPSGPTMNSNPLRVLEFWRHEHGGDWTRQPTLERRLTED